MLLICVCLYMNCREQKSLAPSISLLKYMTTRVSLSVSEQACQIFGGRAITKSGMGVFDVDVLHTVDVVYRCSWFNVHAYDGYCER